MQITILHVRKTAGTALFKLLETYFKPNEVAWSPDADSRYSRPEVKLVASHSPMRNLPLTDGVERLLVTCIRSPADRLVSLYRYFRSMSWSMLAQMPNPAATAAKNTPLLEWLQNDELAYWTDNGLVSFFCDDPAAPIDAQLASAKKNIDRMDFIFANQSMESDVTDFLSCVGMPLKAITSVNVTDDNHATEARNFERADPVELNEDVIAALEKRNSADSELYQYALDAKSRINEKLTAFSQTRSILYNVRKLYPDMLISAPAFASSPSVLASGWGEVEEWHVWSAEPLVRLSFEVCAGVTSCILKMQPAVNDSRQIIRTRFTVNNEMSMRVWFIGGSARIITDPSDEESVCIVSAAAPSELEIPLTQDSDQDRRVSVVIEFENSVSPQQLGISSDARHLNIGLYSIRASSTYRVPAIGWKRLS